MESWTFMPGTPADREAVLALYRACTALPGCTWSQDYPTSETYDDDVAHGWLYCLRERGHIIAAVSVGDFGELIGDGIPWSAAERPCELARIGVLPSRGGQGIGRCLLGHAICVARSKGHDAMRILVSPGNQPALALYRRAGFCTVAEVDRFDHHWLCQELTPLA